MPILLALLLSAADPSIVPTTAASAVATAAALLRAAVAVEPNAARVPLSPGSEAVVDPRATFELELSARSPDARLALVDAREDVVPATGVRELAGGTRLTFVPSGPLVPGSRYALRLDGASDRELHDAGGRPYAPLTLPILVAGTPPPPEPAAKRSKRGRASRR